MLRTWRSRLDPGGKGLNVSRALSLHGVPTRAVVPVGGVEGEQLLALARDAGLSLVPVAVSGSARTNVAIVESDGTVTKLNDPGPVLRPDELQRLLDALSETLEPSAEPAETGPLAGQGERWVVASGSLPPGAPADCYAQIVRLGHEAGARVAVDSSGAALGASLGAEPDLLAPNRAELAEVTNLPAASLAEVVAACRVVQDRGASAVLASLGRDGAVLLEGRRPPLYGESPSVRPRSSVGAGDALLAGFVAAGATGAGALAEGLAWGAAAAALPGSVMPGPEDVARVRALGIGVRLVDRVISERPLSD